MDILDSSPYVLLLALIGIIAYLVWKRVVSPPPPPPSPSLTLVLGTSSVEAGSSLGFSGTLKQGTTPLGSKTVAIAITPPSGDGYAQTVVTGADGTFSSSFSVPSSGPVGSWKIGGSYTGASVVEKTFTFDAVGESPIFRRV